MPKVSVIVPVYNTEKYLRQCLDSVVNQTLQDIEVICIDDGSTDDSKRILDEYAHRDARILVYSKENGGQSSARNKGMDLAQGDYLYFLDSDDYILDTACNGVQREHNKKLNNGLPILHKVPPKRDYGRYFCIMAEKGGTSHGGLTEKLSPFFHAKKQEVNAYGR